MDETEIVRPEKEVKLSAAMVMAIGALCWKDGLSFIAKISETIVKQATFVASIGEQGAAALSPENIARVVAGSAELCEWLLTRTVKFHNGEALGAPALQLLPVVDVLRLLDASLEVNLSEEVIGLGKSVGGRLAALVPIRPASATSTATSSTMAIPAKS